MQVTKKEKTIQSRVFRLIQPREVREVFLDHPLREGDVAVQPSTGSICHADLRYFTGQRRPEALAKKLPMALIHEGIGVIVESRSDRLQVGQRVIIVPNIPGYVNDGIDPEDCCPACRNGTGDNYCHRGRFLGSGVDGIAQSRLILPAECAIPIPENVPDDIAVLAELCSVSHRAVSQMKHRLAQARVAVFGDGPVGYLAAAVLHHVFGVARDRLLVFGAIPEKLEQFQFSERALVQEYDITSSQPFDIVIECTGGRFSENAIDQAIQLLNPGGALILMGVTEEKVAINTRDVLEKGITLIGSSRSSSEDYHALLAAMGTPECQATLRRLLPDRHIGIRSPEDFAAAMEQAAAHRDWKKTVLDFHW